MSVFFGMGVAAANQRAQWRACPAYAVMRKRSSRTTRASNLKGMQVRGQGVVHVGCISSAACKPLHVHKLKAALAIAPFRRIS